LPQPRAVYEAALAGTLNQMLERPSGVGALSMIELHLLINDNTSLYLDPAVPTHAPTSAQSLRVPAIPQEHGAKNASYVDALMP
jgi:hypothetical protein